MAKPYEIVILGAHHAGISTAHYLLRYVLPSLSKLTPETKYHVTIVAPHTEYFYNIPGPRAAVNADLVPLEKIFFPIANAFKEYDVEQYAFVLGKAIAVDEQKKAVTVQLVEAKGERVLNYSTLVVATGSKANSNLWYVVSCSFLLSRKTDLYLSLLGT